MLTESFPDSSGYGLGVIIENDPTLFGYGGGHFGLNSLMLYAPSLDTSLAFTVNASDGVYSSLIDDFREQVFSVL